MRVSREQVARNREAILAAAGRLFRERGFEAVSLADVMKAAGFTHGGFYCYFANKDELIAETVAQLLAEPPASPAITLDQLAASYLSPAHRDNVADGCPLAALAREAGRQSGAARAALTAGLQRQIDHIAMMLPGDDQPARRRAAIGSWAAMVGALVLARMSDDPQLADDILDETRAWLTAHTCSLRS